MAIFHLSVKPVSRKVGRSATGAAAYRAGELVYDHASGEAFDYTRKRGVEHAEIVLPTHAVRQDINWARDREALWNAAEASERRSNSRVAREYEVALPHELTQSQRRVLVQRFAQEIADRHGVAVDFAIHAPHRSGDARNHHAHLLATTRVIEPAGLGEKSSMEWSDANRRKAGLEPAKEEMHEIRSRWADLQNQQFRELGLPWRVDHRSLEAQGIEREPTSHLGPAVSGMQRRGMQTEVGKRLEREALEAAQRRLEKAAELGKIEREGRELSASIIDVTGDLNAAKRERDRKLAPDVEHSKPMLTLEERQREGRERWLAMRAQQKAQEQVLKRSPERGIEKTPEAGRSLEEERLQAIERWRAYRREQQAERGMSLDRQKTLERRVEREASRLQGIRLERGTEATNEMASDSAPALDLSALKAQGRAAAQEWREALHERHAQEQRQARERAQQQKVLEQFQALARSRERQAYGFSDRSPEWQATPQGLRDGLDRYNALPVKARQMAAERLMGDPKILRELDRQMQLRHERVQELDRGLEL